ncbi:MAG: amino acid ABC transporter permease [Prochlorotrichaceae cyanobacterium]
MEIISFGLGEWSGRVLLVAKLGTLLIGVMLGRSFCPSLKDVGNWSLPLVWGIGALIAVLLKWGIGAIAFEVSLLLGVTWVWFRPQVPPWIGVQTLLGLGIGGLIMVLPPVSLAYRAALMGELGLFLAGVVVGKGCARLNWGSWLPLLWFMSFWLGLWFLRGGFGLAIVSTNDWSGLLLTVFLSVISIALCFPLGVILALGRQSNLFALRWLSILHIEVIRGVPLISILFMGQVMIPLFLPEGMRPDRVLRAIVGLTLFSAVYMAENIRGGLQSISKGQVEAANALGLSSPLTIGLIVLPQALKVSIPAIIGQFISLMQDTTLLSIVGLLELLGLSRAILANPEFVGRNGETYLFIGILYWFFCYAMSLGGRRLEKSLSREHH